MLGGDGENNAYGDKLDDGGEDLVEINTVFLGVAVGDEARFELLNRAIWAWLDDVPDEDGNFPGGTCSLVGSRLGSRNLSGQIVLSECSEFQFTSPDNFRIT